jgi:two-component system response regulator DesR
MSTAHRMLLADDDREVRLGVADLLRDLDLEILHAESGPEAIELVKSQEIHAALLDMYMPGCTGIEALPRLFEEREGLQCIVYSGRWTPGLERSVIDAGALACLKKPVEPELLRMEVRRALRILPNDNTLN